MYNNSLFFVLKIKFYKESFMHNPNSAIERVKNHLAYKLGQAMIDFTNSSSGGGVYSII